MSAPTTERTFSAKVLADWLRARSARLALEHSEDEGGRGGDARLAAEFGVSDRTMYRYRHQLSGMGKPTEGYTRKLIEQLFADSVWHPWDVFEDWPDDRQFDRFCPACHEVVTVGDDSLCPWCESPTQAAEAKERLWCEGCDRMVWPTNVGRCWRCEGSLAAAPWQPCKCGCGEQIHRFDRWGRRVEYVRGHAPRRNARAGEPMDAEPFAGFVTDRVLRHDRVGAVASQLGLTREELVGLLEGRFSEFPRERVTKALWLAARVGGGKGTPVDASVPRLHELYPDADRGKVCPGCGGGKAPQAELCKGCRLARGRKSRASPMRLNEQRLAEAAERRAKGESIPAIARDLLEHTAYSSAESLEQALRNAFWQRERAA